MVNYFDEGAPEFEIVESMSDDYYRIKVWFKDSGGLHNQPRTSYFSAFCAPFFGGAIQGELYLLHKNIHDLIHL